jgi:hypothetical protein
MTRVFLSRGIVVQHKLDQMHHLTRPRIDTSPTLRAKQDALAKKLRMEKSEAERDDELLQQMMAKANEAAAATSSSSKVADGEVSETITTKELIRDSADEPIKLQMQVKTTTFGKPGFGSGFKKFEPKKLSSLASSSNPLKRPASTANSEPPSNSSSAPRKLTALEEIIQEEQRKKQRIESGLGRR